MNTKRLKAYKFRIYPNESQQVQFAKTFGCVRYFRNHLVALFNTKPEEGVKKEKEPTSTEFRKTQSWLQEISASTLQQKQKDFKEQKQQYFSETRKSKTGRPKFTKKSGRQSFRLPNQKFEYFRDSSKLKLEKIKGLVKVKTDRSIPLNAYFLSVTVSKEPCGEYYASILVEEDTHILSRTERAVGVDVGLKTFGTFSDDRSDIENPRFFNENQVKLKKAQQSLSRKQKGSNRREKARLKVAKIHSKIKKQRQHFLHNISINLIRDYDLICIEDLDIAGIKKKKKLSKGVSDVAWGEFFRMLEYKAKWYGKFIQKIDRYYPSSKTCTCGHVNHDLTLDQREWTCSSCGKIHSRDLLAAQNILKEGLRIFNN